jgi:hypothetical protein
MSLIVTYINKYGIVHASDSNLSRDGSSAGEGQKTFPIKHLNAALTVAGCYSVSGTSMGEWMKNFIDIRSKVGDKSLENFAEYLRSLLEINMLPSEKQRGCMVHIAGYVGEGKESHPEFWFVRNFYGIDQITGEYTRIEDRFEKSEDFWTKFSNNQELTQWFQNRYQVFGNGYVAGRIGFFMLLPKMTEFFNVIWGNPNWKFRPPETIEETELLVKLYFQVISTLFAISDYSALFIGGDIQTYVVPYAA